MHQARVDTLRANTRAGSSDGPSADAEPYADSNGSGTLTERYMHGPGVVNGAVVDELLARTSSGGTTAWYLTDKLGSVDNIVSSSGTVLDTIVYDSFGNITTESNASNGDRLKFTGMEYDSTTGQYDDHARDYDQTLGRFTGLDPVGFGAGDRDLYRYVGNGPVNSTDPSGMGTIVVGPGGISGEFQAGTGQQVPGPYYNWPFTGQGTPGLGNNFPMGEFKVQQQPDGTWRFGTTLGNGMGFSGAPGAPEPPEPVDPPKTPRDTVPPYQRSPYPPPSPNPNRPVLPELWEWDLDWEFEDTPPTPPMQQVPGQPPTQPPPTGITGLPGGAVAPGQQLPPGMTAPGDPQASSPSGPGTMSSPGSGNGWSPVPPIPDPGQLGPVPSDPDASGPQEGGGSSLGGSPVPEPPTLLMVCPACYAALQLYRYLTSA
jgi:RHS repeat-associated protein